MCSRHDDYPPHDEPPATAALRDRLQARRAKNEARNADRYAEAITGARAIRRAQMDRDTSCPDGGAQDSEWRRRAWYRAAWIDPRAIAAELATGCPTDFPWRPRYAFTVNDNPRTLRP